ncbi:DUF3618 domain-containing protein [Leekyejoonella antrihumi]|uniref:DUF3618 domain-containing protein n=1 Tax=Leekyejoonella antrihumi TaxID=1660198 RepID=A0A563E681_9MICO|nr:DUF3618 domain-containing protein [Leekyejoonella antrihumi]TWP37701.1 DUF3618 domain-containing protein [Leekyejoonella antrihumi]
MADKAKAKKPKPPTAKQVEADLAASRERLAGTIDELAFRAQPKEIAKRQVESAKLRANDMTRTPEGDVDNAKVGKIAGGLGGVLLVLGLLRRVRS